jgi:hypothetical protein
MCGPSASQKAAANTEQTVSQEMAANAATIFGQNENILKAITGALEPIVAAGPDQYGFSTQEDAAMRSQATNTLAAEGNNATNAVRSSLASRGGGNTLLPSGSEAAIESSLAENQATQQSQAQLGITQQGYNTGRANFFGAESALAGAPGALESPETSAGTAAEGAANQALEGATQIQQEENAWVAPVEGMIGGVLGGIAPVFGGLGGGILGGLAQGGNSGGH